ncbi:hypothetical protein SALBM135S_04409 [Streptomyces alboniger]
MKIASLGMADSTPSKEARERLDALDESLTSLVQGGKADIAAAALKRLTAEYGKGGRDVSKLTGQLDGYKQALANKKESEEQLAAESMGLFGAQAQQVQAKLDAQKRSTDGLRQSIIALNEVNRGAGGPRGPGSVHRRGCEADHVARLGAADGQRRAGPEQPQGARCGGRAHRPRAEDRGGRHRIA